MVYQAVEAAIRVDYGSSSKFGHEYLRMFDRPLRRTVATAKIVTMTARFLDT